MLYKKAALNISATVVATFFTAICYIITSRVLGPTKMGQYSYALWLINVCVLISTGGIPLALTRFIPELEKELGKQGINLLTRKLLFFTIISSLCCSLFLAFIFPILKDASSYILYLRLIALIIPFASISLVLTSYLQGKQQFSRIAITTIVGSCISTIILVVAVFFYKNVNILIAAYGLYAVLNMFLLLGFTRIGKGKGTLKYKEIIQYIISVSCILLLDAIVWDKSEVFFLKRFAQDQQIAFYSIAYALVGAVSTLVPTALFTVLVPAYASLTGISKEKERMKIYFVSSRYLALFILPIACIGAALATPLTKYILGNQYIGEIGTLRVMFITSISGVIATASSSLLYGMKRQKVILYAGILISLLSIVLDILFIPRFSSIGAAFVNGFAQLLGASVGIIYIIRTFHFAFPFRDTVFAGIAAMIAGILVFLTTLLTTNMFFLIALSLLSTGIYLFILKVCGVLKEEDWQLGKNIYVYIKSSKQILRIKNT